MRARTRERITVVGLALGLICIVAWFVFRKPDRGPETTMPSTEPAAAATEGTLPAVASDGVKDSVVGPPSDPAGIAHESPRERTAGEVALAPSPPAVPEWQPQPEEEFSESDFTDVGRGVVFDLGRYRARVGEEFDIVVRFAGPPLMLLVLGLEYDPAVVQVVENSARPVGSVVRSGIEFYADNTQGRLVLLQSGSPGMKNVNRSTGDFLAAFRMIGIAAGNTALRLGEKGSTFANGRGEPETVTCIGGAIAVVP